jgi:peptidoglycan/LPS O-acetylase OafA/YrhL
MLTKEPALDYQEYRQAKHFAGLDSLRCFSVLAVVWHHTGSELASVNLPIVGRGYLGVTMFFVISGYLITTLLLREFRANQKIDYKKFMARRALRIFPLYYAVLALYVLLVVLLESESAAGEAFWVNLPYFLSYTSNYFVPLNDGRVIFYFSWSLATEEQFYLVWPLILALLKPKLASYLMVLSTVFIGLNLEFSISDHILFENVPLAICLGATLAILANARAGYGWLRRIVGYPYAPAMAIFILLAALNAVEESSIIIPTLMTLLLAALVLNPHSRTVELLSVKWILFVGKVSYGIYLLHQLSANAVRMMFAWLSLEPSSLFYFGLTSLISVGAATISYYFFEKYFLELKFRYSV